MTSKDRGVALVKCKICGRVKNGESVVVIKEEKI